MIYEIIWQERVALRTSQKTPGTARLQTLGFRIRLELSEISGGAEHIFG